eukprot:3022125-Pleurochrysis_carterae.AAC.5
MTGGDERWRRRSTAGAARGTDGRRTEGAGGATATPSSRVVAYGRKGVCAREGCALRRRVFRAVVQSEDVVARTLVVCNVQRSGFLGSRGREPGSNLRRS